MTDTGPIVAPPTTHNNPPDPIVELVDRLTDTHTELLGRHQELLAANERIPDACSDQATYDKLATTSKICTTFIKNAKAAREAAKAPYLALGNAAFSFFTKKMEEVELVKTRVGRIQTAYDVERANAERRLREQEAAERQRLADEETARATEIARQEAERAAEVERARLAALPPAEAAAAPPPAPVAPTARETAAVDRADQLQADADRARRLAAVKPAELSRTRNDFGVTSSLRSTWKGEIEDTSLIPRQYLKVDETAINNAIRTATTKDGKCDLEIPGVRIYQHYQTVNS